MKNSKEWYKLDAFAKTYSSIISEGRTTCFRLSVLLSEEIDTDLLKKTALFLEQKYPFYNSELKKGIFWNYLQHKRNGFSVELENTYPCTDVKRENPLKIIYFRKKISLEIAHFLTDGIGASDFFIDLIEKYLEMKYFKREVNEREVGNNEETNNLKYKYEMEKSSKNEKISEYSDLYSKYMKRVNKEKTVKHAFHIPLKILEKGQYYVTTGEISIEDIKRESRKYNTTVGKYLLAVYFKILLDKYPQIKKQIVIGVPVDLRKIFSEKTYRNFFINITPSIDPSLGSYTLEEIIKYVNNYFKIKITKKEFYKSIYKAINPMRNIFIKSVPYLIKRIFFPFIFDYYGERGYTTGVSNLGILKLNRKYSKYIKGFRFLPPPSKRCKIKMGIISDESKVYLSFGNLTANHEIEKEYFTYLRRRGIKSKISTNY
ncbi:alcohol acetyltransferase [Leptotrichia sp. OH3620_COT-345]|uniref:alcohol acetyltransferase n=1 Tax=Leptotrichia sp. OH3620_COT-345 TaxID=2491048 RepID=UPI000F64A331|nr:alcohol acetyltransferase [Leptotrichia sp. OH3620_COT-345]RRD40440.1 alcohol acetyltransferase [Leptotrichia sp. OH3620_COT-345]